MSATEVVEADLTWTGTRFEPDVRIAIGADGRIAAVGRLPAEPTRRLAGRALLPGFVNAHSHAFQRALRGQAERFPAGGGSFWTWREAMYRLVDRLDEDALHRVCLQAFGEMLDAGITTVGEFHYLHHARDSKDFALDAVVLGAAARAGIRIVLLEAYYVTGGIGRPLEGAPLRFDSISPQAYWRQMDRLDAVRDPKTQSLGAVAHSIRAARPEDIGSLYAEASRRGLVFHLHMEEQPKEIEETLAAYGQRPLELLNETLGRAERVTAVHCTHSEAEDLTRFLARGGRVCICPLTEANLGDGIPGPLPAVNASSRISLGTDSNARISMLEEMRWLEYGQRLATRTRGAIAAPDGSVAPALIHIATAGGARSLGIEAGRIEAGCWADLAVIDRRHPSLAGCDADTLPAALVFGADNEVIAETCVGGRWRDRARG